MAEGQENVLRDPPPEGAIVEDNGDVVQPYQGQGAEKNRLDRDNPVSDEEEPITSYETDHAHLPNINYTIKYYDSFEYQPAIETISESDINPNVSASVFHSKHNCIVYCKCSILETGKERFPEERVIVGSNFFKNKNIIVTYSKSFNVK